MNKEWLEQIRKNQLLVAIAAFCLIAAIVMAVCVGVLKDPVVPICVLTILEGAMASLLHHAELWIHVVLVLAQILAGIFLGQAALVILCAVIYAAATVTLKYLMTEEG